MHRSRFVRPLLVLLAGLVVFPVTHAQTAVRTAVAPGITLPLNGTIEHPADGVVRERLTPTAQSGVQEAFIDAALAEHPSIDLPGSYGGRLVLDSPAGAAIAESIIRTDLVTTADRTWRREYRAVYAGMGMWDCVIRCYSDVDGRDLSVTLVQTMTAGKPGEEVNGAPLRTESVRATLLTRMQDATSPAVQRLTALLGSLSIDQ